MKEGENSGKWKDKNADMSKKIDEIDRHSQEVQDLLGKMPSWLIRNGTLLVIILVMVLVFGSWRFKYPDLVSGTATVTINAADSSLLAGSVKIDGSDVEKIRTGQPVNLKFDSYPYLKFGLVRGVVGKISSVPKGEGYEVEIQLPGRLITTLGKELEFSQELKGSAEIVTEDISLLSRILGPVKAVFSRRNTK